MSYWQKFMLYKMMLTLELLHQKGCLFCNVMDYSFLKKEKLLWDFNRDTNSLGLTEQVHDCYQFLSTVKNLLTFIVQWAVSGQSLKVTCFAFANLSIFATERTSLMFWPASRNSDTRFLHLSLWKKKPEIAPEQNDISFIFSQPRNIPGSTFITGRKRDETQHKCCSCDDNCN